MFPRSASEGANDKHVIVSSYLFWGIEFLFPMANVYPSGNALFLRLSWGKNYRLATTRLLCQTHQTNTGRPKATDECQLVAGAKAGSASWLRIMAEASVDTYLTQLTYQQSGRDVVTRLASHSTQVLWIESKLASKPSLNWWTDRSVVFTHSAKDCLMDNEELYPHQVETLCAHPQGLPW